MALERTIDAPMDRVWTVLRHYAQARPRILTGHFGDYVIHEGDRRSGTVIGYGLRVGAVAAPYLVAVEEPTPGRQLQRDRSSALVATWTLPVARPQIVSRVQSSTPAFDPRGRRQARP
jgi:hypothetical protein